MFSLGLFSSNNQITSNDSKSRLQKAIERNRTKQQKKIKTGSRSLGSNRGGRESVGRPDNIQFTNIRGTRTNNILHPNIRSRSNNRGDSELKKKFLKSCIILGWIFCIMFFGQLIIGARGVIDFYKLDSEYKEMVNRYQSIFNDNQKISQEIERLKKDNAYQKKLVRDNLGFISKNEYLILFQNRRGFSPP